MPISETEVKRILAERRSSHSASVLSVVIPDPGKDTRSSPDGRTYKILFRAYREPRPSYPRANAASQDTQSNVLRGFVLKVLSNFPE
jgi:hypothetical protein